MGRLLLMVPLTIGCGSDDSRTPRGEGVTGSAEVGGDVVSTVDGVAITKQEVATAARQLETEAPVALARLQAELLLASDASRHGFEAGGDVRVRQAQVQALLAEIEDSVDPHAYPEDEIRAAYEASSGSLDRPERRRASHVLVVFSPEEAMAQPERDAQARLLAAHILEELEADPRATLGRMRSQGQRDGFEISVADLPPYTRDADVEPEFLSAIFAIDGPGVASEPARTGYGWHAIVLHEIEAAREHTYESAALEIRESRANQERFQRLQALLAELQDRVGVTRNEGVIERVMERDDW